MAVITFPNNEESWVVARWAFRQLLEDVSNNLHNNPEIIREFEEAVALDGLHLGLMEHEIANNIIISIQQVASGIINGTIHTTVLKNYPDLHSEKMYINGLLELVKLLEYYNLGYRRI